MKAGGSTVGSHCECAPEGLIMHRGCLCEHGNGSNDHNGINDTIIIMPTMAIKSAMAIIMAMRNNNGDDSVDGNDIKVQHLILHKRMPATQ